MSIEILPLMAQRRAAIEAALDRLLPPEDAPPAPLHRALRYSVLGGGKRLRPLLVLAAAEAAGRDDMDGLLPTACALEFIHSYSLIHDDLPALDNDDVRRGRPACHRAFGEATALLAGDGLLTLAFRCLAMPVPGVASDRQLLIVAEVAAAAGVAGMVGGQAEDIAAEGQALPIETLKAINRKKTGALFRAAARAGALLGGAGPAALDAVTAYAEHFGAAFQILDDLADGGPFPTLVGDGRARAMARETLAAAVAAVEPFGARAVLLRELAAMMAAVAGEGLH